MNLRGTQNWVDILQECLNEMNNSTHSRLKMTPNQMALKKIRANSKKFTK